MYGMFFEVCFDRALYLHSYLKCLQNGPIRIHPDYSMTSNDYSWNKLADYFWIDQPVSVLRLGVFYKRAYLSSGASDIPLRTQMVMVSSLSKHCDTRVFN